MVEFFAHWNDDKKQELKEHLINVARLSESYSVEKLKRIVFLCGLYHDLGKYTNEFQKKIDDPQIRTSHSDCGAYEMYKRGKEDIPKPIAFLLAYCISGHHTGLKDGGSRGDGENDATLWAALNSAKEKSYEYFKTEIDKTDLSKSDIDDFISYFSDCGNDKERIMEKYVFLTKYIFSCLTDADFIDTENFFSPEAQRGYSANFEMAFKVLETYMGHLDSVTELQKARSVLQEQAWKNSERKNIYFLNMPTGSGKTLCSLKLALKEAIRLNKKRIIYVIPYTAIIEQTAEQFEKIIGEYVPILQHHSNYDFEKGNKDSDDKISENSSTVDKLKKSTENWDHPFIITTNIQFFQSVYGYKSRELRKLHNMADSIIVFDEIHILPFKYLKPCLRSIFYICNILNSKALLMSATMPDYSSVIESFADTNMVEQLITDRTAFKYFKKNQYKFLDKISREKLIDMTDEYKSSLIVVNSRKMAKELFELLNRRDTKCCHLSTYMTAVDRSGVINEIKESLGKEKITVVSTSLIEVGVDLDFEVVFRETAGLDNILQSGGRCNREGKREKGNVFVFDFNENINYRGDIAINANIVRNLFNEYNDIGSTECVVEYYKRLFIHHKDEISKNTIGKLKSFDAIPFRTYSQSFRLIEETSYGIVIPCEENAELIERLKNGDNSVKRALSRYTASVKFYELKELIENGIIEEIYGMPILSNKDCYDKDKGIDIKNDLLYVY